MQLIWIVGLPLCWLIAVVALGLEGPAAFGLSGIFALVGGFVVLGRRAKGRRARSEAR